MTRRRLATVARHAGLMIDAIDGRTAFVQHRGTTFCLVDEGDHWTVEVVNRPDRKATVSALVTDATLALALVMVVADLKHGRAA